MLCNPVTGGKDAAVFGFDSTAVGRGRGSGAKHLFAHNHQLLGKCSLTCLLTCNFQTLILTNKKTFKVGLYFDGKIWFDQLPCLWVKTGSQPSSHRRNARLDCRQNGEKGPWPLLGTSCGCPLSIGAECGQPGVILCRNDWWWSWSLFSAKPSGFICAIF